MLAQNENLIEEARRLQAIFKENHEWLNAENSFSLQSDEIEIAVQNNGLMLSYLTVQGWQTWRVLSWKAEERKISFSVSGKFNSKKQKIELIARVSALELRADAQSARLIRAHEIAELARAEFSANSKIVRVGLNASNYRRQIGTIAQILLTNRSGKLIAVCSSVLNKTDVENLLTHSILWLAKLEERRKISELWLISETETSDDLLKLHALLRKVWQNKIKIYSLVKKEDKEFLQAAAPLKMPDLWHEKPKKISHHKSIEISESAQRILELAPQEIDVIYSRYGETLRYQGLPFARVRKTLGKEQIWFGVETKRILDESSLPDFEKMLADLSDNRHPEIQNKKNFLNKSSSEAWLESILRRDVSALDPNLILAPLHAQFRLANKKGALDLLALRTDGRLVVIELKTSTDRTLIFQAVNYWREIEHQRRSGNLQRAKFFNDLAIADAAPLVYLVAPLMSFHHEFDYLARTVSPEIEIWRFDLNEDWRKSVKVARRQKVSG